MIWAQAEYTFYNQMYQLILNYSSTAAAHCESFETSQCSQKIKFLWDPALKAKQIYSASLSQTSQKRILI